MMEGRRPAPWCPRRYARPDSHHIRLVPAHSLARLPGRGRVSRVGSESGQCCAREGFEAGSLVVRPSVWCREYWKLKPLEVPQNLPLVPVTLGPSQETHWFCLFVSLVARSYTTRSTFWFPEWPLQWNPENGPTCRFAGFHRSAFTVRVLTPIPAYPCGSRAAFPCLAHLCSGSLMESPWIHPTLHTFPWIHPCPTPGSASTPPALPWVCPTPPAPSLESPLGPPHPSRPFPGVTPGSALPIPPLPCSQRAVAVGRASE